ncbi:MAG: dihydrofolate reductase [Actinobacteria bacterium]|nr:MAG: dihydrofolate reductase [Actinomycetota bacterium]
MSKLVVSEFLTLDGVMEDPGGAEDFDRGGWAFQFERGAAGDKFKLEETMAADALLLGRVTYEGFAKAWPDRTDQVGFADKMNNMPKYVVSRTLERAAWNNSTVLDGDVAGEVAKLKEQGGGEIVVAGSAMLVQTLIEHQLVDEYRLMVFPVVLGAGKRLFADTGTTNALRLAQSQAVGDGVLILTYHPVSAAEQAASA